MKLNPSNLDFDDGSSLSYTIGRSSVKRYNPKSRKLVDMTDEHWNAWKICICECTYSSLW